MVAMERVGDHIVMEGPMVAVQRFREIPGGRHDAKDRKWKYPLSWATCVVARGVFGNELEVGPDLAAWAKEEYERRILPALQAREASE